MKGLFYEMVGMLYDRYRDNGVINLRAEKEDKGFEIVVEVRLDNGERVKVIVKGRKVRMKAKR